MYVYIYIYIYTHTYVYIHLYEAHAAVLTAEAQPDYREFARRGMLKWSVGVKMWFPTSPYVRSLVV